MVPVTFAPVVALLIDRSVDGITMLEESRAICAFRVPGIWAVKPKECKLCAQGSRRLKPKKPQINWAYLTGRVAMP